MESNDCFLNSAIDRVDDEQSVLEREIRSFEDFRETVRLISPDPETVERSATARELRSAYRTKVMEPTRYEARYGDNLAASLDMEFDSAIADNLLSPNPVTHKRKRTLLVKTAETIDRREQFLKTLSMEHEALTSFRSELETLHTTIDELPPCSAEEVNFEQLVGVWETYNQLEDQCNHLIERRQQQLSDTDRRLQIHGTTHGLWRYLYEDLESRYPVLMSIATTVNRITTNRGNTDSAAPSSRSMTD